MKSFLPIEMDARFTLCGRTALELVLRDILIQRTIRKAYLPSYCCHTMIEPFTAKGIEVKFYNVFFTETGIGFDFEESNDCDMVFLMDYFGFRKEKTSQIAKSQKSMGKCVIYDATHSILCKGVDYSAYNYAFGSFRKWFNVNAGFCAKRGEWCSFPELMQNTAYNQIRNTAFEEKKQYMAGKVIEKQQFLEAFSQAEESLETNYTGYAPDARSLHILRTVNVEFIRKKRTENATYVITQINAMSSETYRSMYQQVRLEDCPLFVPLKVDRVARAPLRQLLIDNNIYLPIHWPLSRLHTINDFSKQIYNTELSFVCDQRYNLEDMSRAIEIIRSFNHG